MFRMANSQRFHATMNPIRLVEPELRPLVEPALERHHAVEPHRDAADGR